MAEGEGEVSGSCLFDYSPVWLYAHNGSPVLKKYDVKSGVWSPAGPALWYGHERGWEPIKEKK